VVEVEHGAARAPQRVAFHVLALDLFVFRFCYALRHRRALPGATRAALFFFTWCYVMDLLRE
jgi:hypothetical protein